MEKQKRWHLVLILAVIALTVYNILPTVFFYTKPLSKPIGPKEATTISLDMMKRVNNLEGESLGWVRSFTKLLGVKASSVKLDESNPNLIYVDFITSDDAEKFRTYLPRAGALIPFVPAQLFLGNQDTDVASKRVVIQRKIPVHFEKNSADNIFDFAAKRDESGSVTSEYRDLVNDRFLEIGLAVGGTTENAQFLNAALSNPNDPRSGEFLLVLAQNILNYTKVFGEESSIAKRYYSTFTQGTFSEPSRAADNMVSAFDQLKDKIKLQRISLEREEADLKQSGQFLDAIQKEKLSLLHSHEERLTAAAAIARKHRSAFSASGNPWTYAGLSKELSSGQDILSVGKNNPLINEIEIDWVSETFVLNLHSDVARLKKQYESEKNPSYQAKQLNQLIYDEIARLSRECDEEITPLKENFQIALSDLNGSESFIVMRLEALAEKEMQQLQSYLEKSWHPKHPDLQRNVFPIWDQKTYETLPASEQRLGLVLYAPVMENARPHQGFKTSSVYVVAKGAEEILRKYRGNPDSSGAEQFLDDFRRLQDILKNNGYFGYPGTTYPLGQKFSRDFIFESEDFFQTILKATREDFAVRGTKHLATLELSNVEQRILTINKIETEMHEDLLKWRDEYGAMLVNPDPASHFDVPKPTKNALLNNLRLSFVKYFRGDDRKILHWGLDLSGGKTVQIELRDQTGRVVTDEADINQGINELYNRVNKMGVSEVNILQEGNHITLDFPGAQGLSAADLIKASSMQFHVVNEKFGMSNSTLREATNRFLQEVWNEAVVTNKKDIDSLQTIAWSHLMGDSGDLDAIEPRSEAAKTLYANGLRLAAPGDHQMSSAFNDSSSKIAQMRGDSFTDWQGQTHPLLIVFKNQALEGAQLQNVHASYDPSKGNFLSFEVKGSSARGDLYNWTSTYSKEKVTGTPLANYSDGRGWRMAVILNGTVISSPNLESALRESAMITGSFTQREINKLEADLKAGSLSFTPHILSEKNVSPELGLKERTQGIMATAFALLLVILLMVSYYRFAGIIASVAVIFNLLIMWGALQNLQATITLAGIAGIILTVGMAVDANVLVFERIREEFKATGRVASSVSAGYRKAFSAIADSNITTIIAALILLNFDSGPIKGFAITLIIGIVSSMFTALFMTRYFFGKWAQNPKRKMLKMMNLIKESSVNFIKHSKICITASILIALVGSFLLISQKKTIFGMDFTGGYSMNLELEVNPEQDYRKSVEGALVKAGAPLQDFEIRQLTPENNLRLFFGTSMDASGKPFFGMPLETNKRDVDYAFENNPRITWVVDALASSGIELSTKTLKELETNWTSISGQMSDSMRTNALIGLGIALLCILLYITIRFEFKYAISATVCLAHDVIVVLGMVAILFALGLPTQIDLNTIAALMTIVGYSLNDTIIIFDRIREDLKAKKKCSFVDVINGALNTTLSRTVMTSMTTLVVLLALVFLGGSSIFGFALVMTLGVIFGTLSSLFIAAPILLYFHRREVAADKKVLPSRKKA